MKVTVESVYAVATWKWDVKESMCSVCRSEFEIPCPDCTSGGDGCPPLSGDCGHTFHHHCIVKWLQAKAHKKQCPLCRQPFNEALLQQL